MSTQTITEGIESPTSNLSNNPDPISFTEYLSGTKLPNFIQINSPSNNDPPKPTQYLSLATSPNTPVYAIKVRLIARAKPDIELYLGQDLSSQLAAVARLHLRNHDFGIPNEEREGEGHVLTKDGRGEEFMTWENLKRITRWSERLYGFEWGVGRQRKSYTWVKTKPTGAMGRIGDMRELELRVGNKEEAENGGECLAKWVRGKGPKTGKKGSLYVKRREDGVEDKGWEGVVLITFLMILELFVRKGGG